MSVPIEYALPSGRHVTLRLPTMGDRENLLRRFTDEFKADGAAGLLRAREEADTLLPRECLLSDSEEHGGGLDGDARYRCAKWSLADMTSYLIFFGELTSLTQEEAADAREAAKSVRAGLRRGA